MPPAQKRKRRKRRWCAGVYAKRKLSPSHQACKDNGSDEVEDDEEEILKAIAECDEEGDESTDDAEVTYAVAQGGRLEEQDTEEEQTQVNSDVSKNKVNLPESKNYDSDEKTQNNMVNVDTDQSEQMR